MSEKCQKKCHFLVRKRTTFLVRVFLLCFGTLKEGPKTGIPDISIWQNGVVFGQNVRKWPIFGHFRQNGRKSPLFGHFATLIPVFPKVQYGMKINRFCILLIPPSCIFKQKYRMPKPLKNGVKSVENGQKMVEKWPIFGHFSSIFCHFRHPPGLAEVSVFWRKHP